MMSSYTRVDYLVIGHISRDLTDHRSVPGGTALYSALAAQALGCQVAIVTSVSLDYDVASLLPGIAVQVVPSKETTTFRNTYEGSHREQTIYKVASRLKPKDVPDEWRRASIVHLGPVADEIDPQMIKLFSNSVIGVTPQGWYRRWNADGRVYADEWHDAEGILPFTAAVILSPEDIPNLDQIEELRKAAPIVVLTRQEHGCDVYFQDTVRELPAPVVTEVEPTGAGDIFAAAFLIRLHQTKGNPWESAEFANLVASTAITQRKLEDKVKSIREILSREI